MLAWNSQSSCFKPLKCCDCRWMPPHSTSDPFKITYISFFLTLPHCLHIYQLHLLYIQKIALLSWVPIMWDRCLTFEFSYQCHPHIIALTCPNHGEFRTYLLNNTRLFGSFAFPGVSEHHNWNTLHILEIIIQIHHFHLSFSHSKSSHVPCPLSVLQSPFSLLLIYRYVFS